MPVGAELVCGKFPAILGAGDEAVRFIPPPVGEAPDEIGVSLLREKSL